MNIAFPFRPPSLNDFARCAKSLKQVIDLPLQKCQELLARIYGYSGAHELRQALASPGDVGVFDDSPGDIPWKDQQEMKRARFLRIEEILIPALSVRPNAVDAARLCQHAGLFSRPTVNREKMADILNALPLVRDRAWPADAAVEWVRGYLTDWTVDFAPMESMVCVEGSPYDPRRMVARQRAYREPTLFLKAFANRDEPIPILPALDSLPWDEYARESCYPDERWQKDLPDWGEYVINVLRPHLGLAEASGTEEEIEVLYDFQSNPSETDARTNPWLKDISNIVEIARQWERACFAALAQAIVDYRQKTGAYSMLKLADRTLISEDGQPDGWLECFVDLTLKDEMVEFNSLSAYHYNAVFLHGYDRSGGKVVGTMSGLLVVPFKGRTCPGDDDFMWAMDSMSAFANDVWKVIVFDYFKKRGYRSVEHFLHEHGFGNNFVTVEVEIAPNFRGTGLLEQMLSLFCSAIDDGVMTQYDRGWREFPSTDIGPVGYDDGDNDEDLGTVAAIIFPVEGTQPPQPLQLSMMDLGHIGSPKKVRIKPDPVIEARRQKLEKHFLGLQGKITHEDYDGQDAIVDVLVYDPWSFPLT